MPSVLWLTPVPPDRHGGGGHIRQAHLLEALSRRAEIHLVCSGRVADPFVREAAATVTELSVSEENWGTTPRALRRIRDIALALGSRPREVAAFAPVCRSMIPLLSGSRCSTVIIEYAGLAPLVSRRSPKQRWILTLHNLGSAMSSHEAAVAEGRRQRWLYRRDAAAARRWEQSMVSRYDRVIAVSEADAQVLQPADPGKVTVVPNGVELRDSTPAGLPADPVVVFTGALYTGPNRDGIGWFCREIWPIVLRDRPDARLLIVGSRPTPDVERLAGDPGVELIPDVPEIWGYLDRARVAIVPLRIGSGTRLKALEAMAAARPVVGTSIGLEGLGLVDGHHAAFADDPVSFAAAINRALSDESWAAALAKNGLRMVEDQYGWQSIGANFADTVLERQ